MKSIDDLKEFAISERIEILLQEQKKTLPKASEEEMKITDKGLKYLESLDEDTHQILIAYIDQLFSIVARDETYLYTQGFIDGIKVFRTFMKL